MWRNFSTLQSVIWKNFSSWQIFSPQAPLVVLVTNIRYDHMEWVAGGPTKILRTNLVCNWPKNDPRTVWLAQCRKCKNLQEVRADTLGSPTLAQEGYWNPKYSEYLSLVKPLMATPILAIRDPLNNQKLAQNNCWLGCPVWGSKTLRSDWIEVRSSHGTSHPTYQNQIYDLGTPNFGQKRPKNGHENGQQSHREAIFHQILALFRPH